MTTDERAICLFLKAWHGQWVSAKVVSRRVGGRQRYADSPQWAKPILSRLVEKDVIETDSSGHYRLKPRDRKRTRRWLSPEMRRRLSRGGQPVEVIHEIDDELGLLDD